MQPADTRARVHLSVAEARALSERAMRGIGYDAEEAWILADHVLDAALCGYEYSGLPKLLNVADYPSFRAPRHPMRVVSETSVSVLFDGGNQSGMLGMYYATRAAIERADVHGLALVGVRNIWMSGRSAYYVALAAHGRPTTDAAAARRGAILPFGGHKGYALALAMHALGVLCGDTEQRAGYLVIAFKPDLFMPLDDYRRELAGEIARIKATPLQEGVEEIRLPGERAYRERARLAREGIEIDRRIHDALVRLAEGSS